MVRTREIFSGFSVNDLNKAKEFYTKVIGLEIVDETMGLNLQLTGGGKLFIYPKEDHQPASFTILNLVVDNIDETVDALVNQGVEFEHYEVGPKSDDKGIVRGRAANMGPDIAWFKDPAGNIISVLQDK